MFHNENKLIFALKESFLFLFLRREQRRKGKRRREVTRSCLGVGRAGMGQDYPAERLSRLKAAWTLGRRQGILYHWMDGWMVASS